MLHALDHFYEALAALALLEARSRDTNIVLVGVIKKSRAAPRIDFDGVDREFD